MTQWFVKDLSKLTGVSVQTLHHYDRIGLLEPSARRSNGYRVYSERDLLKLQQIIALKFFGFELAQIKTLLTEESSALNHFNNQAQVLEQKAAALLEGAKTLRSMIHSIGKSKSIPWETIIQLIEVYRMAEHLEHDWVKEIFTPDELKQYVEFEKEMKTNTSPEQQAVFEKKWQDLVGEVKNNLRQDPNSKIGIDLGQKLMDWVNGVYGKKYAHLRTKKFEKGFGEGKGLDEVGLTPELVVWMDKAMDAYWRERIYGILNQVGKTPSATLLSLWKEMLVDMYGEETARQNAIYEIVLNDEKVSPNAKDWLQGILNSLEHSGKKS
ncbi:MerR family transcriptional regulator [Fluoribacter dumoffii]|uniref:Multidrug transporter activation protein n=1 Tax=Fluoribacter dumoffii TaxID=463 RepID=A0A377G707_9GAMM|nr:MerR family transcriptional regulator [Fluoribacter dumoffii]KTC89320.1 MerR family transcriptional regulator [Fluoribacter dumoffii NY 23]MCW8386921.1 MerR family transcriptional regulator [Fluoribacter dumoffii]MCW8417575.1 MerR family transcriptional regulator [Fluoribacter dumoffii]MCW8454584.1 MerR family transcriptional regulator [Fluoribacter dumoffii]MCW8461340.1 MerR family transcriptional regulator [Fluoribacter dumoffii]